MEAKAQPKTMIAATMQMVQLIRKMISIKVMNTTAMIHITTSTVIVASWRISSFNHTSRMSMIWGTSACQTIQIVDMSIMAPFLNKKKRMRTKNH